MLITSQRWGCRFSSDQYRIDESLPFFANNLLAHAFMMTGLVIVLIYTQVHFWSLPKISFSVKWQDGLPQKEESRREQKAFEKHVKRCVNNLSLLRRKTWVLRKLISENHWRKMNMLKSFGCSGPLWWWRYQLATSSGYCRFNLHLE